MIVRGEEFDTLARLDLDRHDLVSETASFPGGIGKLLAADGVAVLLLSSNAVLDGAVLGRAGHRAAAVSVEQRRPEVVLELPLTEAQTVAEPANHVRRL